jgi:ribonuclease-3
VDFFKNFFKESQGSSFKKELKNILGYKPYNISLYKTALTHRSVRESADENNERLEYLGDAVLSAMVADYLFKRYPYKGEGFLTEMRSKMVNRTQLNDIAIRMGLKKVTYFNKLDGSLKMSQIFGNTLEALVGAVYLDLGYKKASSWVMDHIILPHMLWMIWKILRSTIKTNSTAGLIRMERISSLKHWKKKLRMAVVCLRSAL